MPMTYRGHIRNGAVVLDERPDLPDGTPVSVTARALPPKKRLSSVQRMEKAGPSRTKLRRLAKTRRPPQSWYDETINPFKPAAK
jgi:hypothetical protein